MTRRLRHVVSIISPYNRGEKIFLSSLAILKKHQHNAPIPEFFTTISHLTPGLKVVPQIRAGRTIYLPAQLTEKSSIYHAMRWSIAKEGFSTKIPLAQRFITNLLDASNKTGLAYKYKKVLNVAVLQSRVNYKPRPRFRHYKKKKIQTALILKNLRAKYLRRLKKKKEKKFTSRKIRRLFTRRVRKWYFRISINRYLKQRKFRYKTPKQKKRLKKKAEARKKTPKNRKIMRKRRFFKASNSKRLQLNLKYNLKKSLLNLQHIGKTKNNVFPIVKLYNKSFISVPRSRLKFTLRKQRERVNLLKKLKTRLFFRLRKKKLGFRIYKKKHKKKKFNFKALVLKLKKKYKFKKNRKKRALKKKRRIAIRKLVYLTDKITSEFAAKFKKPLALVYSRTLKKKVKQLDSKKKKKVLENFKNQVQHSTLLNLTTKIISRITGNLIKVKKKAKRLPKKFFSSTHNTKNKIINETIK